MVKADSVPDGKRPVSMAGVDMDRRSEVAITYPQRRNMKLTTKKREMLSSIASSPRLPSQFTHGMAQIMKPDIVLMYLAEMHEAGYIFENSAGQYEITHLGRRKLEEKEKESITEIPTWRMRGTYRTGDGDTPIFQRPGSDHAHLKRLGF